MIITKTPLRISFFSGGSDIPSFYRQHGGAALSGTINKYVYVSVHYSFTREGIRMMYDATEDAPSAADVTHAITRETLKFHNINSGITISSISDIVGRGSGLGASSSYTVGLIRSIQPDISVPDLVDTACYIEIDMCGHPIGKQDQCAASYRGLNLFQFHQDDTITVTPSELSVHALYDLSNYLILVNTGVPRSANDILQKQKEAMSDSDKVALITRNRDRAFVGMELLKGNNYHEFGRLLHESWEDKKNIVKDITYDSFDELYERARAAGALGGKILGAGGGGFFLLCVPPSKRDAVLETIKDYKVLPFRFEVNNHENIVTI